MAGKELPKMPSKSIRMGILNKIYLYFFSLIFVLTIMVNIHMGISTFVGFYHPEETTAKLKENKVYQALGFIEYEPISSFLSYTGFDTGYGFFAPNVASEYITEFRVYSKDSVELHLSNFPKLMTKEGVSRVRTSYLMFHEYMKENKDSIEINKCDIFLKGISMKVLKEHESAEFVKTKVYLYHHPLLEQLNEDPNMEPIYLLIKSKTYFKNENWENY